MEAGTAGRQGAVRPYPRTTFPALSMPRLARSVGPWRAQGVDGLPSQAPPEAAAYLDVRPQRQPKTILRVRSRAEPVKCLADVAAEEGYQKPVFASEGEGLAPGSPAVPRPKLPPRQSEQQRPAQPVRTRADRCHAPPQPQLQQRAPVAKRCSDSSTQSRRGHQLAPAPTSSANQQRQQAPCAPLPVHTISFNPPHSHANEGFAIDHVGGEDWRGSGQQAGALTDLAASLGSSSSSSSSNNNNGCQPNLCNTQK